MLCLVDFDIVDMVSPLHSWKTLRLCRGVNKSSFCKSEHIKDFMQHVSGESQVL